MIYNLRFKRFPRSIMSLASKINFYLFAYLLICLFFVQRANAQEFNVGIYPPIIQIDAKAPSTIEAPLTVTNEGGDQLYLMISLKSFKPSSDNNGTVEYVSSNSLTDPSIFDKIQVLYNGIATNELPLAPQQSKDLKLHIELPQGEPPSDYYFSILFSSTAVAANANSSPFPDQISYASVNGGIGTNVLLSIGPKDPTSGFLNEFSVPWLVQNGPVPFKILINNNSNHFIVPQGNILIKNMYGQTIGKVNLLGVNILAKSSRYIRDDNLSTNNELLATSQPFAVWPEKFLLGPYKATLSIALSPEGPLFKKTIYFFAMPIEPMIILILCLIIIGIIVYRIRQRLKK